MDLAVKRGSGLGETKWSSMFLEADVHAAWFGEFPLDGGASDSALFLVLAANTKKEVLLRRSELYPGTRSKRGTHAKY